MSAQLGNGTVRFGDGTVQSTKTPSNVSAFTNDSVYLTPTTANVTYAKQAEAAGSINCPNPGYGLTIWLTNINGTNISGGLFNCNCNC